MKRIFSILCTVLLMFSTACGADTAEAEPVNAETVYRSLSDHMENVSPHSSELTARLIGLQEEDIIDAYSSFASDQGAQLLVVVETVDEATALKASERLNYYLATLQNSASQYAPDQLALLNEGYIYTNDNIAVLIVSPTASEAKQELASLFHGS